MIFIIILISSLFGFSIGYLMFINIMKKESSGTIRVTMDPDDNAPYIFLEFENANEINTVINSHYVTLKVVRK